jgi:hypothetical protein
VALADPAAAAVRQDPVAAVHQDLPEEAKKINHKNDPRPEIRITTYFRPLILHLEDIFIYLSLFNGSDQQSSSCLASPEYRACLSVFYGKYAHNDLDTGRERLFPLYELLLHEGIRAFRSSPWPVDL